MKDQTKIIYETIEVDENGEYEITADPKVIYHTKELLMEEKKQKLILDIEIKQCKLENNPLLNLSPAEKSELDSVTYKQSEEAKKLLEEYEIILKALRSNGIYCQKCGCTEMLCGANGVGCQSGK